MADCDDRSLVGEVIFRRRVSIIREWSRQGISGPMQPTSKRSKIDDDDAKMQRSHGMFCGADRLLAVGEGVSIQSIQGEAAAS